MRLQKTHFIEPNVFKYDTRWRGLTFHTDTTLKKATGLSEYVTKVIKNLFSNSIFKSLIEKWLIYHIEKELNDFGLKIRIFEISKIEIFEKKFFTGSCSCDHKISFPEIL